MDAGGNYYARVFDFGDSTHTEYFGPGGVNGEHTDTLVFSAAQDFDYGINNIAWLDLSNQGLPADGMVWVARPGGCLHAGPPFPLRPDHSKNRGGRRAGGSRAMVCGW